LIPHHRPDLDIHFKGDLIYYYVLNLENHYVTQFIAPYCLWIFLSAIILSLPYFTGFILYFFLVRIAHKSISYFFRQVFLPAFSIAGIKKDLYEMRVELVPLLEKWKTYPPFFGEFYVLAVVSCYFSIVFAVLFL
jgi:hypothetical protein